MKDPFTLIAQKAYAEYSRSPEKGYVKNGKNIFCPVCQTTFLYTQVEYHGKSKKHQKKLRLLQDVQQIFDNTLKDDSVIVATDTKVLTITL